MRNAIGSSPPVRGTLREVKRDDLDLRFIPACAGNTLGHDPPHYNLPVHPRLCGEHMPQSRQGQRQGGSSPPVRGTPGIVVRKDISLRFIPACAGNTRNYPH